MYNFVLQINHIIKSPTNLDTLTIYPELKLGQSVSNLLGYSVCNEIEKHKYFMWFPNLYNLGEVVIIPTITTIYKYWFLAYLRPPNPIEEFDFKYHKELSNLLEGDSIGLLFELGKKSNAQS